MKVVFLQDNGINESLSLCDVAGLLGDRGHDCELFLRRNEKRFYENAAAVRPGLIVIPMDIWGERKAIGMSEKIKELTDAPVVFCGTYPLLIPEVIGFRPVEAGALNDQHLFLTEQVEGKLLVVADVELVHVQLREQIQRTFGRDA